MTHLKATKQLRRTLIILCIMLLPSVAIAQEKNQTVTIQQTNISLREAFALIESQTNYSIAYEHSALDVDKKISLSFKDADIEKVLNQILKETQHTYKVTGYHIIISLSTENAAIKPNSGKLTQTIRGIIINTKTYVQCVSRKRMDGWEA